MNNDEIIKQLQDELERTKQELVLTKEHLKKYTAPSCKKQYYENNKEEIKKKHKEYTPTEEQKKKWARTAYLKKKDKLEKQKSTEEKI